ncbi:MAG: transcription initiation factor IIB [Thermoplasmatota archaeon]
MAYVSYDCDQTCSECGSINIVFDPVRGEAHCSDCGFVLTETGFQHDPLGSKTDSGEQQGNSGPPVKKGGSKQTMLTYIGLDGIDSKGTPITPQKKGEISRLRQIQNRMIGSDAAGSFTHIMSESGRLVSSLDLPQAVMNDIEDLARRVLKERIGRGNSTRDFASALVYLSCRRRSIPISLNDVATFQGIDRKRIGRLYRNLVRDLNIRISHLSPADFVSRFGRNLQLNPQTEERAREIISESETAGITSGKDPAGFAAAAIYISGKMTGQIRTQKEIAAHTGVSEVTIRNRYQEILKRLDIVNF